MSKKEYILKNVFKVRAYENVIKQLKQLPKLTSIHDLVGITGIGKKIKEKI